MRFSDDTLKMFARYFQDELEAVENYYSREHIYEVVNNPHVRKQNFHGKVKDGRMDFSGNGGKFRYFSGIGERNFGTDDNPIFLDMNERLEYAFNKQKFMESSDTSTGLSSLREDDSELDGFELVRREVRKIRQKYFGNNG